MFSMHVMLVGACLKIVLWSHDWRSTASITCSWYWWSKSSKQSKTIGCVGPSALFTCIQHTITDVLMTLDVPSTMSATARQHRVITKHGTVFAMYHVHAGKCFGGNFANFTVGKCGKSWRDKPCKEDSDCLSGQMPLMALFHVMRFSSYLLHVTSDWLADLFHLISVYYCHWQRPWICCGRFVFSLSSWTAYFIHTINQWHTAKTKLRIAQQVTYH